MKPRIFEMRSQHCANFAIFCFVGLNLCMSFRHLWSRSGQARENDSGRNRPGSKLTVPSQHLAGVNEEESPVSMVGRWYFECGANALLTANVSAIVSYVKNRNCMKTRINKWLQYACRINNYSTSVMQPFIYYFHTFFM